MTAEQRALEHIQQLESDLRECQDNHKKAWEIINDKNKEIEELKTSNSIPQSNKENDWIEKRIRAEYNKYKYNPIIDFIKTAASKIQIELNTSQLTKGRDDEKIKSVLLDLYNLEETFKSSGYPSVAKAIEGITNKLKS